MPKRYFFHLRDRQASIQDTIGVDAAHDAEAAVMAAEAVEDFRREEAGHETQYVGWELVVVDSEGTLVTRIRIFPGLM